LSVKGKLEYYKLVLNIRCVSYFVTSHLLFVSCDMGKSIIYDKVVFENLEIIKVIFT